MSDNTKISYVDATWSPVIGCTKCSPGCENCYAEKMAFRLMAMERSRLENELGGKYSQVIGRIGGWTGNIICDKSALDKPLHWRKPRRILVPSMGDLFHEKVPFGFISDTYEVTAKCPQHDFYFLTKRPEKAAEFYRKYVWKPRTPNIHLGVTISTQKEADEKIPILLQIPAAHRWISIEPMLEEIDLFRSMPCGYYCSEDVGHVDHNTLRGINGIVVGCESGPKRRPCDPDWIRSIVQQCKAASVKCFVKQIEINGKVSHNPAEWPEELRVRDLP